MPDKAAEKSPARADLPMNWQELTMGDMFTRRIEPGRAGLPTMSIVMGRGMVERESVERRVDTNLRPEDHLVARSGDIAYNMMRMWQGVLGRAKQDCLISPAYIVLQPNSTIDSHFAEYALSTQKVIAMFKRLSYGVVDDRLRLYHRDLVRISFAIPRDCIEQHAIARILSTLDSAIEQTEAVITKYQKINGGLMHDLFTHGLTPNGKVRQRFGKKLHHFRELTPMPSEWRTCEIEELLESLVDGPFGSNLKSEHYVSAPGVRLVRLQNIGPGIYDDSDAAYISTRHADQLSRNRVQSGDVLVAGLGEDNNVVGRACCYPPELPDAINKADCFRLRCAQTRCLNRFLMYFLNSHRARIQVRRFEQGVTRRRINTTNLKRVRVPLPPKSEQARIAETLDAINQRLEEEQRRNAKLRLQKQGLMHDLLTGRVRVNLEKATAT